MNENDTNDALVWPLRDGPLSFQLSLIAGFVDTAGFVGLFGIFTAHVTGNLMLVGASLVKTDQIGVIARLTAIPIFMAAIIVAVWLAQTARRRNCSVLVVLLWAETAALLGLLLFNVYFAAQLHTPDQQTLLVAMSFFAIAAMGIHNSLMKEAAGTLPPTTVMTGNLTGFSTDLFLLFQSSTAEERKKVLARLRRVSPVLLGFVLGAALGAAGIAWLQWWSAILPLAIAAMLALAASRQRATKPDSKT